MTLKEKIVQVSYELFGSKGYEKTTIADIVKASESSKGGFYHHFKSKEDIIDSILNDYIDDLKEYYQGLFKQYDNDTIKVFNGVFEAINTYKSKQMARWPELMKMLSFEGNTIVITRMAHSFEKMTESFYLDLIIKGNQEGLWTIESPSNIAGLWTRELLRIYTEISHALFNYSLDNYNKLVSLVSFDEKLINSLLSIDQISILEETLNYFDLAKTQIDKMHPTQ